MVDTVKGLFEINEVDIQWAVPFNIAKMVEASKSQVASINILK